MVLVKYQWKLIHASDAEDPDCTTRLYGKQSFRGSRIDINSLWYGKRYDLTSKWEIFLVFIPGRTDLCVCVDVIKFGWLLIKTASKIFGIISTQKSKTYYFKIPVQKSYTFGFILLSLMTFVSATITQLRVSYCQDNLRQFFYTWLFWMVLSKIKPKLCNYISKYSTL